MNKLFTGDALTTLQRLPSGIVQTCVTSPPYFGLRDYNVCGQIGMERTVDEFLAKLVDVFREVRRTLKDDGTLWLNLGDSYAGSGPSGASYQSKTTRERANKITDGDFRISRIEVLP
jgi:DNA modification methylase